MTRSKQDAAALLRQALAALGQSDKPDAANDEIDEEAIRELARRDAEEMRRARNR